MLMKPFKSHVEVVSHFVSIAGEREGEGRERERERGSNKVIATESKYVHEHTCGVSRLLADTPYYQE